MDQKPDFSGTWRFNPTASSLQIAAPDDTIFVITHQEPRLSLSRTHVIGDQRDTFSLELTTDGQEVLLDKESFQLRARAGWDGESLVFRADVVRAGEEGTNLVRYTLADDRNSIVAVERFRSRSMNYDNVWMLDRL